MGVLKGVGYLVAALVVLTALAFGAVVIVSVAIIGGLILSFCGSLFFTASAIKAYWEVPPERSDPD